MSFPNVPLISDMSRRPYTLKTIWECHKAMAKVYYFEVKVVFLIQNLLALVTSTVSWQRNGLFIIIMCGLYPFLMNKQTI